jgi:hypothetical protein
MKEHQNQLGTQRRRQNFWKHFPLLLLFILTFFIWASHADSPRGLCRPNTSFVKLVSFHCLHKVEVRTTLMSCCEAGKSTNCDSALQRAAESLMPAGRPFVLLCAWAEEQPWRPRHSSALQTIITGRYRTISLKRYIHVFVSSDTIRLIIVIDVHHWVPSATSSRITKRCGWAVKHSCFVFGKSRNKTSARRPNIFAENFQGFTVTLGKFRDSKWDFSFSRQNIQSAFHEKVPVRGGALMRFGGKVYWWVD